MKLSTILSAMPVSALRTIQTINLTPEQIVDTLMVIYEALPESPRTTTWDRAALLDEFWQQFTSPHSEGHQVRWDKLLAAGATERPPVVQCSHTPEPWHTGDAGSIQADAIFNDGVGDDCHMIAEVWSDSEDNEKDMDGAHANALRIVVCVNACAGIPDPAAELARLREQEAGAAAMREVMESFTGQCDCENGKVCDHCSRWNKALSTNAGIDFLRRLQAAESELEHATVQRERYTAAVIKMAEELGLEQASERLNPELVLDTLRRQLEVAAHKMDGVK